MAPATAMYLLRFDDLCPAMKWAMWDQIEDLLVKNHVRPILAIVPDNRDTKLICGPLAPDFWDRARQWQERGWTIGLHGYQHLYVSEHAGIVGTRKKSEFAGVAKTEQAAKLRKGLEIFHAQGLKASVWVAPGHTFDESTVSLLEDFGINIISDGFARFPFRRGNMTWVPQQLWEFRKAPRGVWTICFHHNDWQQSDLLQFEEQLTAYRSQLSDLNQALAWSNDTFDPARLLLTQPAYADVFIRAQLKIHELASRF